MYENTAASESNDDILSVIEHVFRRRSASSNRSMTDLIFTWRRCVSGNR